VFNGDVDVEGALSKSSGSFKIDHPIDANNYLYHSFVESPDMLNIYSGNVTTDGSFTIKTSKPGVKVSRMVTGIRQDAWANAHRIQVEVDKASRDQGHYIHPELFGHAGEPSILEMHHPRLPAPAPSQ
jgi:trimeric autotransporter adhesin